MAIDPSTGHEFAELPETTPEHVAEMVADARRALREEEDWRYPTVRAGALTRLARLVEAEAGALADFETRDTGTPLTRAKDDVLKTGQIITHYAGAIEHLHGASLPRGPKTLDYSIREPWGVCALILGSSAPLRTAASHAVPALAAGNAVIVKPSELGSI